MREPPRILIVDDNAANRRHPRDAGCDAHGYELLTAADGEEALERARERAARTSSCSTS